ncbi:sugar ABC transporter permease [Acholeplasma equirhinis]|uniref:carbohydrate ABC transporter permease n=1 Tax=Acholeplasma equirhinis TaxID=555393 RepID=UPI00197A7FB2|nr:sugar ABC transporter permease [Acholeplasma equirhinis]MBN3490398.1 sugar ABC transporter permease [Acholeplasma equirhinis]
MKKIRTFFSSIKSFFSKLKKDFKHYTYHYFLRYFVIAWRWIGDKWYQYVTPVLGKIGHFLTHNALLKIDNLHIRLFGIRFKNTRKGRDIFYGFLFISLWLIGFLVFTLYPLVYSFYLSFTESYFTTSTGINSSFHGMNNYFNILQDQRLLPMYVGYLGKMMLSVPLVIIFSMIIAMLINQPIKGKGLWRTIFFLPVIISTGPIITELTTQGAVSLPSLENNAVILYIANNLGEWIADPVMALLNSLLLVLWYAGIPILIFLAALQKIDKSIYEASSIDGASPWDNFWKITLPSIKPFISINVVYVVVSMSSFVEPGGILNLTQIHMIFGSSLDVNWHGYGYAASMAWIYFILMVVVMGFYVGLLSIKRKESR